MHLSAQEQIMLNSKISRTLTEISIKADSSDFGSLEYKNIFWI